MQRGCRFKLTELPDIHDIVFVLENSSLVVINIKVVWRTEDGHNTGEPSRPGLPVHSVARILGLVGTNDGQEVVLFEERAGGGV